MNVRAGERRGRRRPIVDVPREDEVVALARDRVEHTETSPRLTGGDLDADWHGAWETGDEAVGGSVATPDQSVVDELGEALGIAQAPDAEVVASSDILADRDRHRWDLEQDAAREDETPRRRGRRRGRWS